MNNNFIPAFHLLTKAEDKTKPEWFKLAMQHHWYQTDNISLCNGKNVDEIDQYSEGRFSMKPFKKSLKKEKKVEFDESGEKEDDDLNDSIFEPLPLLPNKFNAAEAIVHKVPVDIGVKAMGALAFANKSEDLNFLRNKPKFAASMKGMTDTLGIDPVDLGTTRHSDVPYSESPFGLDLTDPEDAAIVGDLIYSLDVESAFEIILQSTYKTNAGDMLRLLEIRDQLRYGVSVNIPSSDDLTKLPVFSRVHPQDMRVPWSSLPDYSDNPHRFMYKRVSALEFFNMFKDEIGSEGNLDNILNNPVDGYCCKHGGAPQDSVNWGTFGVNLLYCEIKSIDWIGVKPLNAKSRFKTFTTEDGPSVQKKWAQNTYYAWWLEGTDFYYGIDKLGWATRQKGKEAVQSFSSNIYKSQAKSASELCVSENKKAQYADIKCQNAVLKSVPSGRFFDLKYIHNAIAQLSKGEESVFSAKQLIEMAVYDNNMVGDSEGFDGVNEGQYMPIRESKGGFDLAEISGYLQVIADANNKIGMITGINEQITGQSANPEGLVGMQKLLISQAITQLRYINVAIEEQTRKMVSVWSNIIQEGLKDAVIRKAYEKIVGAKKVSLIASLKEIPLHQMGVFVSIVQREEERAKYERELERMKQMGVLSVVDDYILSALDNPKEQRGFLAARYKQFERKQDKVRAEQNEQQQVLMQQQGANAQGKVKAQGEADINTVYAKGDVDSKLLNQTDQVSLSQRQMDAAIKHGLQSERGKDQLNKAIKTLQAKYNLEKQRPAPITPVTTEGSTVGEGAQV